MGTSNFERIQLSEKLFHALADVIAFAIECADLFLECFHQVALFVELSVEFAGVLLCGGARLALALDEANGSGDTVFQRGKVGAAESEITLAVVVHFRMLGVFRDLGFQG
jgi:hypothetical protein